MSDLSFVTSGLAAARPPSDPLMAGRLFWASDTKQMFSDNGSGWTCIIETDGAPEFASMRTLGQQRLQASAGTHVHPEGIPAPRFLVGARVVNNAVAIAAGDRHGLVERRDWDETQSEWEYAFTDQLGDGVTAFDSTLSAYTADTASTTATYTIGDPVKDADGNQGTVVARDWIASEPGWYYFYEDENDSSVIHEDWESDLSSVSTPFLSSILFKGTDIEFTSPTSTVGPFLTVEVDFNANDGDGNLTTETETSTAASQAHTRNIYADLELEESDTELYFWMRVPMPTAAEALISESNGPSSFTIKVYASESAYDSGAAALAEVTSEEIDDWDKSPSGHPGKLEMRLGAETSIASQAAGVAAVITRFFGDRRRTSVNYFYVVDIAFANPNT